MFYVNTFSFFLSIPLGVKLLGHRVTLFSWGMPNCFPKQLHYFTFLTSSVCRFWFLRILTNTYYYYLTLIVAILVAMILICISLMVWSRFSWAYWYIFLGEMSIQILCTFKKIGLFVYYWAIWVYKFWIQVSYQITWLANIFSHL